MKNGRLPALVSSVLLVLLLMGMGLVTACAKPTGPTTPTTPTIPTTPTKPTTTPTAPTTAFKPIKMKFSYSTPPTGWTAVRAWQPWAKKLEEATNGRIKVDHYPSESLHPLAQAYDSIRGGVTDIAWISLSQNPGVFPLSEVEQLPFLALPSGKVDGQTLGDGEINSLLWEEFFETTPEIQAEWSKIKVLLAHKSSAFIPFTVKKQIRTLNDFKGFKIIVSGGPPTDMYKALGAVPGQFAPNDYYSNLEKGVVEGVSYAWAGMESYRLFELCKYWIDMPTYSAVYVMGMNLEKWKSLPADIQQQIMTVGGKFGSRFIGEAAWPANEKDLVLERVKAAGLSSTKVSLDPGEYEKIVQAGGKPVWDKWIAEKEAKGLPAKKILDAKLQLIEKYRTK